MNYFIHGANIAAVESDEQADKYAAAGWVETTHDEHIRRWRLRDLMVLYRLRVEAYHEARRAEAQAAKERQLIKVRERRMMRRGKAGISKGA
jgi:hypothetical protein